jgi:hypothetical protein
LIASLRDVGYNNTTSAVCEHIDNAIQARATEIRVFFRQTGKQPDQTIDVAVYDNGFGMAPHVLKVPGVLQELRTRNPTEPGTGRRKWKHHQFLSEDLGQPDLRDHLLQLVAVMRASQNWTVFERNFEAAFPKRGTQIEMVLETD